jgi:putative redox protein
MSSNVNVVRGAGKLQHVVKVGPHQLIADAPSQYGGDDAGFTPHDLLAASLGACTALTLNMYAQRKGFPLQKVDVEVEHADKDGTYVFNRHLTFHGDLSAEQKESLVGIANKCPIHKILSGQIEIVTDAN